MNSKKQKEQVTIYQADSRNSSFFRMVINIFSDLSAAHQIGLRFFKRDIKAQYRQSLLGFFWALFPPILTAGLWIFLKNNQVADFGETTIPYPIFVFTGTMLWQIFSESLNTPLQTISANKSILIKLNVPKEGLLLSGIYKLSFSIAIKLAILVVFFFIFGLDMSWSLLLVPLGVFSIVLCGFSIGMLLIPAGMLYGDVNRIVTVALPFAMYLTPVVYPPNFNGAIGVVMKLNPMAPLLNTTRDWFTSQPVQNLDNFFILVAAFMMLLILGLVVFKKSLPFIIERIGS